jgi:hypothetical protein
MNNGLSRRAIERHAAVPVQTMRRWEREGWLTPSVQATGVSVFTGAVLLSFTYAEPDFT